MHRGHFPRDRRHVVQQVRGGHGAAEPGQKYLLQVPPSASWNLPCSQAVHEDVPAVAANVPAAHLSQSAADSMDENPASQSLHSVAPFCDWNLPAWQSLQTALRVFGWNCPATQLVQLAVPPRLTLPATHDLHVMTESGTEVRDQVPAGHARHLVKSLRS